MVEFNRYRVEGDPAALTAETRVAMGRLPNLVRRTDTWAVRFSQRPFRATATLLGINAAAALAFASAAAWLLSDPAEPFRELAPLTWLSFGELAFVAATAWAIHLRVDSSRRAVWADFWSLSAVFFAIFAIDELTQATIFLSHAVETLGAVAPGGFHDLDAFLLTVLFLAAAAGLARYAPEVLRHPPAVALLGIGVALGVASQALDSTQAVTTSSIVLEEGFKLAAEPFILGGYLVVLHRVTRRGRDGSSPAIGA